MADDRRYSDDDVRAIVDHALRAQPESGLTHEDLLAVGAGVGLSQQSLESAAREVAEARSNEAALASVKRRRQRGVAAHAFVFAAVNAVLFLINYLTTPGEWWVLFPLVAWGLGLLLHAGFALSRGVSAVRLNREQRRLRLPQPAAALARGTTGVRIESSAAKPAASVSSATLGAEVVEREDDREDETEGRTAEPARKP